MLESVVFPEKLPGQKGVTTQKKKKKKKKNMNFSAFSAFFTNSPDMNICNFFDVYVFILLRQCTDTNFFIHSAFLCFSRGSQNSALIPIAKTSAGNISVSSWLRC